MQTTQKVQVAAWGITAAAVSLALIAWGQYLRWQIFGTSTYLLFPVFGLVAFSLLWAQYITLAMRMYFKPNAGSLATYFKVSGWILLVAILLHPGLLIWQLWRDGAGLPPASYVHYVMPSLEFAVVLGTINLIILLLFELRRILAKYTWWRWFTYFVDLVVLSVFYHGLKLGTQIRLGGWYRDVWYFYGGTVLIDLIYIYKTRYADGQLSYTKASHLKEAKHAKAK